MAGSGVFFATGHYCVTVNYAFNFLRPAKGTNQKIRCRATPEKLGRTLCVYHVSLTDDEDVEVANGNFTFLPEGGKGEAAGQKLGPPQKARVPTRERGPFSARAQPRWSRGTKGWRGATAL